MKKNIFILIIAIFLFLPFYTFANSTMDKLGEVNNTGDGSTLYNSTTSVYSIVGYVLNTFLSLLAAIFLILVVINGYKFMTAGGNKDNVEIALNGIKRGIIGLIIILSSLGITNLVINSLVQTETLESESISYH